MVTAAGLRPHRQRAAVAPTLLAADTGLRHDIETLSGIGDLEVGVDQVDAVGVPAKANQGLRREDLEEFRGELDHAVAADDGVLGPCRPSVPTLPSRIVTVRGTDVATTGS